MTSQAIRDFLDTLQAVELPPMERGRANKAAGLLTRVAHHLGVQERSGRAPASAPPHNQATQPGRDASGAEPRPAEQA